MAGKRRGSLKRIAALMHQEVMDTGISTRMLSGGLKLKLHCRDDDIVLVLWRRDVAPSTVELQTCIQNFFINVVPYKIEKKGCYWFVGVKKDAFFGEGYQLTFDVEKGVN